MDAIATSVSRHQESPGREITSPLPQPAGNPRVSDPLRVLIVDDSAIVAQRLTALIESLGLRVVIDVATDGKAGMERFVTTWPQLVVLDIGLPDRSGFGVLMEMKQHRPHCPVAVLTSYAYPEFRVNALRLGADYFFVKALDSERIADVVAELAGRRARGTAAAEDRKDCTRSP